MSDLEVTRVGNVTDPASTCTAGSDHLTPRVGESAAAVEGPAAEIDRDISEDSLSPERLDEHSSQGDPLMLPAEELRAEADQSRKELGGTKTLHFCTSMHDKDARLTTYIYFSFPVEGLACGSNTEIHSYAWVGDISGLDVAHGITTKIVPMRYTSTVVMHKAHEAQSVGKHSRRIHLHRAAEQSRNKLHEQSRGHSRRSARQAFMSAFWAATSASMMASGYLGHLLGGQQASGLERFSNSAGTSGTQSPVWMCYDFEANTGASLLSDEQLQRPQELFGQQMACIPLPGPIPTELWVHIADDTGVKSKEPDPAQLSHPGEESSTAYDQGAPG